MNVVDRHGTVMHVRVVEAQQTTSSFTGAEGSLLSKITSRRAFSGSVAHSISELPDNTLPIRELAAPSRFARYQ